MRADSSVPIEILGRGVLIEVSLARRRRRVTFGGVVSDWICLLSGIDFDASVIEDRGEVYV